MSSEMIYVSDKFLVHRERRQAFLERLPLFTGLLNAQRGLVAARVVAPGQASAPYVVESTWLTRGHFQRWISSPGFVLAIEALSGTAAFPIVASKSTQLADAHTAPLALAA